MIGASMLWVGWFGFNAGSQGGVGGGERAVELAQAAAATSFRPDELVLRNLLHQAVSEIEPRDGTLEHLRRAVAESRAHESAAQRAFQVRQFDARRSTQPLSARRGSEAD